MSLESLLSWQQIFFFKFFFSTHIGLNSKSSKKTKMWLQKPHTCEDGTHLRISAWHLLINFKKLDNLKTWSYKNVRTLTFTMLYFFKKHRKTPGDIIILHLCTKHLHDMIYSFWDVTDWNWWLWVIFCAFTTLKTKKKSRILNKWKKLPEVSFYTCIPKTFYPIIDLAN